MPWVLEKGRTEPPEEELGETHLIPQATLPFSNRTRPQTRSSSLTGKNSCGGAGEQHRDGRESAAMIASEIMFPTYVGRLAIFDDYEFLGDVGSGSFGKVMVVRHRNTKQLRACKVVAVQTALQRELMDTEIKLLKSLNHPNIMKMHEVYFEQAKKARTNYQWQHLLGHRTLRGRRPFLSNPAPLR